MEEGLEIKKSLLEEMERKRINYLELSAKLKSLRNNESELVSTIRDNAVDLEQLEKLRVGDRGTGEAGETLERA